jgi:hypothetical protein
LPDDSRGRGGGLRRAPHPPARQSLRLGMFAIEAPHRGPVYRFNCDTSLSGEQLTLRPASPSNSPLAALSIHLEISPSDEEDDPSEVAFTTSRAFGLNFSSAAVDIVPSLAKLNLGVGGRRWIDRQIYARNMREIVTQKIGCGCVCYLSSTATRACAMSCFFVVDPS